MLGKLFKHEFRTTSKLMLPIELALIGITLLGMLVLGLKIFNNNNTILLGAAMTIFYILGIVALYIVTYVFLMMRFYRSMYAAEGYLTHTLPVSSFATLNTKMLVAVFWSFLTILLTVGSVLALIITAVQTYTQTSFDLNLVFDSIYTATGLSAGKLISSMLLFLLLSCFSGILMIYCSISIGQLFNKYKILAAVITYVVIYIIMQIISLITLIAEDLASVESTGSTATTSMESLEVSIPYLNSSIIQTVLAIIVFYAATAYISNKRVNLD